MCEEVKGRENLWLPLLAADGVAERGDDELTLPKKAVINPVFTVVC